MHKFLVRAASGIVYAAVIILAIIFGEWTIYALALAFAAIGVCELNNMSIGFSGKTLPIFILSTLCVLLFVSIFKFTPVLSLTWRWCLIGIWIILVCLYYLSCNKIRDVSLEEFTDGDYHKAPLFGVGYLGFPLALMTVSPIERLPLLIFVLLWINDSGAYIVGSLTGRHKLCPSVSPNKTWEGFIGGCALTLAGAFLLDRYCSGFFGMENIPLWMWMSTGVFTCVFGTLGDLLESKIKRFYGVKDSGHWIPGHGGILDRIDSFLIAFPMALFLLLLLN
ncbi:MAG: phosphatidate cytidylyltransferase [Muribaculaceae bacterium]|nr:phosphatidate cytidylyltransferase [Muribaculaceae bacterium]